GLKRRSRSEIRQPFAPHVIRRLDPHIHRSRKSRLAGPPGPGNAQGDCTWLLPSPAPPGETTSAKRRAHAGEKMELVRSRIVVARRRQLALSPTRAGLSGENSYGRNKHCAGLSLLQLPSVGIQKCKCEARLF